MGKINVYYRIVIENLEKDKRLL